MRGDEHDLELSRLSSILALLAAVNIFYAFYGLMKKDWVNLLIPIVTYLIIIYAVAIIDSKVEEASRR